MRRKALIIYSLASIVVLTWLGVASFCGNDNLLFNRGGASVAAMSALFIVMQVIIENSEGSAAASERDKIARLRREIDADITKIPQTARTILEVELRNLERTVQRGRIEIALVVGIFASIGEAVHGWGDQIIALIRLA